MPKWKQVTGASEVYCDGEYPGTLPAAVVSGGRTDGRFGWRLMVNDVDAAAWGFAEDEALARALAETAYEHYKGAK